MNNNPEFHFRQNENIFRTLIEEAPTAVGLYVGPDLIIKIANKAIVKICGKGDGIINKPFFDALPELRDQSVSKILKNVYATGVAYEATEDKVELVVNGQLSTFYFNFSFKPLKDIEGNVWGILNTGTDVTELVLTRQMLAESEKRTQFALNAAELGTWDFDPINKLVSCDKRCQYLFGFKENENIPYDGALACVHPDDVAKVNAEVMDAIDPVKRKQYDVKFRVIGPDARLIHWVRSIGRAYFNDQGVCFRFAGTVEDITREMEAQNEQNKLLSLIEQSSDFIAIADQENNITYLNTAGRLMVGLSPEGEIFRKNTDFLMPGQLEKLQKEIYTAVDKTGRWAGEVIYRHFVTGEAIPVYATSIRIDDPVTGESIGRAGVARDLRREKEDKKALIESELLLQNITKAAPIALWMSDDEGRVNYVNQTWMDWTGKTFAESTGQNWLNAILPDDRGKTQDKFIADLKNRRSFEANFRIINKTGDIRWCFASGNPQYRSDGSFAGYISACTDITEKTLAEQQLFLKNEELNDQISQFKFVTGFMPVQLWTATLEGSLDYVNERTLDYFGVDAGKITGSNWILHVHPDDREGCVDAWTHSLKTGEVYQFEFRLKDKYGSYKWHLARALPFISDGKIVKWFGTNTDIDEQKVLERQKDDFLGIASHELKTPVTSIKAYTQVLGAMLTTEGDEKKAAMVDRMDAQINRLTGLIGDLLDVTKINSGKLQFNKTLFDFNLALSETVEDLQHTTQRHKLITHFKEIGEIFADRDRISQVITNLISNAIKYSPHTDEIIITTKKEKDEVIVSVKDFGIGIPADKKDLVFEQFYRVTGDKQHTFAGLGLGLYISSEIIKREGGKMWVNSVEGKGSDFCFALPVNSPQAV